MKAEELRILDQYLHTAERYARGGIAPIVDHARGYLRGKRALPVSRTTTLVGLESLLFTFSDEMMRVLVQETTRLEKPYEVAIKYGFRGYSRGGKNGIFLQREGDSGLLRTTDRLIEEGGIQVVQDLEVTPNQFSGLKKVKIVWHNQTGERVVGVYNTNNSRIIFLGFAKY